jgi:heptosyltransferase-2
MGINDSFKKQNSKTYHEIIHEICGLNYEGAKPFLGLNGEIAKSAEKFKSDFRLKKFSRFYLINLGGGSRWQYKKWTAEGYAEIANRLTENPDIAAGIIAGEEDMDFYFSVEKLILNRPNVLHLGFSNSMENFIAILSVADRILTSDSLAFHIATALEKFVVVLVGPTSHTELDIFNKGKVIYSSSVDCLCCYLNSCGKTVTCMNTLISEHVYMELTSGR